MRQELYFTQNNESYIDFFLSQWGGVYICQNSSNLKHVKYFQ